MATNKALADYDTIIEAIDKLDDRGLYELSSQLLFSLETLSDDKIITSMLFHIVVVQNHLLERISKRSANQRFSALQFNDEIMNRTPFTTAERRPVRPGEKRTTLKHNPFAEALKKVKKDG